MDLSLFPQAIHSFISPNPEKEAFDNANKYLTLLMNNDPFSFGQLTLDLLFSSNEKPVLSICCVLFRRSCSSSYKFLQVEQLNIFFQRLAQNFLNICSNELLQSNFKNLIANSLAFIGSGIFIASKDTSPQAFLTSFLQQNPIYQEYALTAISDMISIIPDELGFPFVTISQIILSTKALSHPILSLFFATASCNITNEGLPPLLTHIMNISTPQTAHILLQNLLDFSENHSLFFFPFIGEFTAKIAGICTDITNPNRVLAILLLGSLASNAPEICSKEAFIEPAVTSLLTVLSQVNDSTPWDYDPNDTSPFTAARQAISQIFASIYATNDALLSQCLQKFHSLVFNQQSTPQQQYSVLLAISEIKNMTFKKEDEQCYKLKKQQEGGKLDLTEFSDLDFSSIDTTYFPTYKFYAPILQILFNVGQGQTRLRSAAYDVISNCSNYTFHILNFSPQLFQTTFSETTQYMQLKGIKTLRSLITAIPGKQLEFYTSTFPHLIQITSQASPQIKPRLILLMGQYGMNLGKYLGTSFPDLLNFFLMQFQVKYENQIQEISNKIAVVTAIGLICKEKGKDHWVPALAEYLNGVLHYGLEFIYSGYTSAEIDIESISSENELDELEKSLIYLIQFIGSAMVLPDANCLLLKKTIDIYLKTLPTILTDPNLSMEGLAAYEKVSSLDKTSHLYVTKSEIKPYAFGLLLLNSMLKVLGSHFDEDQTRCMSIKSIEYLQLVKYILNDYGAVIRIKSPAWSVLINLQYWIPRQNLLQNYIQIFSSSLVNGIKELKIYPDDYILILLSQSKNFITFVGENNIPIEDPSIQEFLKLLVDLLNFVIDSTKRYNQIHEFYNNLNSDSTKFLSKQKNIELFYKLIRTITKYYQPFGLSFFQGVLLERIPEYMENEILSFFACSFLFDFTKITNNFAFLQPVIKFFEKNIEAIHRATYAYHNPTEAGLQISEDSDELEYPYDNTQLGLILPLLSKFFEQVVVPDEIAVTLFNQLTQILLDEGFSSVDHFTWELDKGLQTLCNLMKSKGELFYNPQCLISFFNCLPYWMDDEKGIITVYSFFLSLLQNENVVKVFLEIDPVKLMGEAISHLMCFDQDMVIGYLRFLNNWNHSDPKGYKDTYEEIGPKPMTILSSKIEEFKSLFTWIDP